MGELSDEEIIKKASEIRNRKEREVEKKQQIDLEKTMQGMVGKFYDACMDYDKKSGKLEFYRVLFDDWRNTEVQVEYWTYYRDKYYKVIREKWYGDRRNSRDKEISEAEFMVLVLEFFKKIGIHQILTEESDH